MLILKINLVSRVLACIDLRDFPKSRAPVNWDASGIETSAHDHARDGVNVRRAQSQTLGTSTLIVQIALMICAILQPPHHSVPLRREPQKI